jgi:hypothetical protein
MVWTAADMGLLGAWRGFEKHAGGWRKSRRSLNENRPFEGPVRLAENGRYFFAQTSRALALSAQVAPFSVAVAAAAAPTHSALTMISSALQLPLALADMTTRNVMPGAPGAPACPGGPA